MHGVIEVFDEHLPVALVHEAQAAAGDFELAFGGAIGHVVDRAQRVTKVSLEVLACVIDLDKDEAAVAAHMRHRGEPLGRFALVQAGVFIAFFQRNGEQRAVCFVGPRMVGAAKELAGVAAGGADQFGAFVGAAVHHDAHAVVAVTDHDQRATANFVGDPVASVGELTFMAHVVPGVGKKVFLLELKNFGVNVEVAVHAVGLHQGADCCWIACVRSHGLQISLFGVQRSSARRARWARESQRWLVIRGGLIAVDVRPGGDASMQRASCCPRRRPKPQSATHAGCRLSRGGRCAPRCPSRCRNYADPVHGCRCSP